MQNQTEQSEWDCLLERGDIRGCYRLLEKHIYKRTQVTKEIDQAVKRLPSIEATNEDKSDFLFMAVDVIPTDAITTSLIESAAQFATKETLFRLGMKCADAELSELIAKVVQHGRGEDFTNRLINLYYDRTDSRMDRERHIHALLKALLRCKSPDSPLWQEVSNKVSLDHFVEVGKNRRIARALKGLQIAEETNPNHSGKLVTITRFFKVKPEPNCPCEGEEDEDEE